MAYLIDGPGTIRWAFVGKWSRNPTSIHRQKLIPNTTIKLNVKTTENWESLDEYLHIWGKVQKAFVKKA